MAVLQMQRICICALNKDRKKILELLQQCGVIEITDEITEDSIFHKMDVNVTKSKLQRNVSSSGEALKIIDSLSNEKKSVLSILNGRIVVSTDMYDSFSLKYDTIVHTVNRILVLDKNISEYKAEIHKLQTQIEILSPWSQLDIPMNYSGTSSTVSYIGTLPNSWALEQIYENIIDVDTVDIEIISSSREQTCILVLCTQDKSYTVFEKLRLIGFTQPNITTNKIPQDQMKEYQEHINDLQKQIKNSAEEILSYKTIRDDICFLQDYETMRVGKYDVISHLLQSDKVFVLTGYIPEIEAKNLTELLNQKFDLAIEYEQPSTDEDIPVLLHNNNFSNPLESTVEAYSPPGKTDLDPTMVMSLFYYLLFGVMLSDAGYGIIFAIACGFALIRYKNTLEPSTKRTLRMFLYCGFSTIFWGVMFGSYFGDIIDVISVKFFESNFTIPPLWFIPMNNPMRMLIFSLAFGVIHLLTGLGMKLYLCLKQKDYKAAIYDVLLWYVILISSILMLLPSQMFSDIVGTTINLPPLLTKVLPYLFLLSSIGIILTNGRESKNPLKRFLKGLYALYGITGYLSDVLSYSRLLALGLATGVICMVINKMAAMVGGGFIGVFLFTIIVLIGNTLNIAINAIGAYVHTNRLQYVEFFGKFYEGGGRKFNPFYVNTKYYKFKEK